MQVKVEAFISLVKLLVVERESGGEVGEVLGNSGERWSGVSSLKSKADPFLLHVEALNQQERDAEKCGDASYRLLCFEGEDLNCYGWT